MSRNCTTTSGHSIRRSSAWLNRPKATTSTAIGYLRLIQGNVVPENYNILINLMFSLVFAKMRRLEVKFNCLTYMRFRNTIDYVLQEHKKFVIENPQTFEDHK